jgi:RNA polymerase sigma-70 factor, ECF subfamily
MSLSQNDEQFAELLRRHQTQLFGYLWALVHDPNDAEDLYQQTSIVLWKKFGDYRPGTSFFNWAIAAARYEIFNFLRTRKRRLQFHTDLYARLNSVFDELKTDLLQARLEALRDCREQLDQQDRQLLEACYGGQLNFRETAARLGRTPKNVYNTLVRIRATLLKCIQERLAKQERGS